MGAGASAPDWLLHGPFAKTLHISAIFHSFVTFISSLFVCREKEDRMSARENVLKLTACDGVY